MKFRKFDLIIIGVVVVLSAISFLMNFSPRDYDTKIANIIVDGKTVMSVDLLISEDRKILLDLKENNVISIKGGKIGIISSTCKDKTCKNTGFVSDAGESIVCVPSKLVIEIEGEYNKYDAVLGGAR